MGFRRLPAVLALLVTFLVVPPIADIAVASGAQPAAAFTSTRTVQFGSVTLRVPASWPVISLRRHPRACPRLNVHAVYLGSPGPVSACPAAELMGKTESVQILPVNVASPDLRAANRRIRVAGQPALTNPDSSVTHTIIVVLPAAGLEVALSYGRNLPLVRAIERSILAWPVARAGNGPSQAVVEPANIPAVPAQGVYSGRGFDTCAAPGAGDLNRWLASPYRAIGIYIGGVNRACAQANLTAGWLGQIMRAGWHYFPYYVGLQAPCVDAYGDSTIQVGRAHAEGAAAATDAVQQARDLGIPAGSPLIYDMEGYGGSCSPQVITFLSAWDAGLHAHGYQAGVYESFSNVGDLIAARTRIVMPDVINYADWDGSATTTSSYMPAALWLHHQRLHQYLGNQYQTYRGVTMNIDLDQLDLNLGGPLPVTISSLPLLRIIFAMNANGGAEWFARAANGTIRHAWQHPLGTLRWTTTVPLGNSPANLVSNPAITADRDGLLTLFARTSSGQVVNAWYHVGSPNDWQWGGAIGTSAPGSLAGDPAATHEPGGEVAVFIDNKAGAVLTTRQQEPDSNTAWTPWTSIGGNCASSPVATSGPAGAQVFCITRAGSLAVAVRTQRGWQPWQTVPGLSDLAGVPAVGPSGAGGTTVVATTRAGQLAGAWRRALSGRWITLRPPASQKLVGSPTVTSWPGRRAAVFAELAGGQAGYAVYQPAAGGTGTWHNWTSLSSTAVGVPAAWVNSFGPPAAAVLTARRHVAVSAYTAGVWGGWQDMGGGF